MAQMNKRQFLALGTAGLFAATRPGLAMSARASEPGYDHKPMSVDEMTSSGALLVDIRTPQEWAETGVVEGAVLLTFKKPNQFLAQIRPALADGRDLVLICRSGNRTQAAARALAGEIDNRIISVEGGIKRLIAEGYQPVPAG